eukprot:jgi/Psemu1/10310/gm1.10310_g
MPLGQQANIMLSRQKQMSASRSVKGGNFSRSNPQNPSQRNKRISIGSCRCPNGKFNPINPNDTNVNANQNANWNANPNTTINPNAQLPSNAQPHYCPDYGSIESHEMKFDNQVNIHETETNTYGSCRRNATDEDEEVYDEEERS